MFNNLYELKKKDIGRSAEVISKAFYDYPIMKHIFGNGL